MHARLVRERGETGRDVMSLQRGHNPRFSTAMARFGSVENGRDGGRDGCQLLVWN